MARQRRSRPGSISAFPASQIREDVVLAAMKVFSERSYHGASMQDVADAAGMQKASLYHHVKQKEDLLFAIHDRMVDELTALIIPVVSSSRTPPDKIREIIRVATRFIADHREGATVLLQELGLVKGPRWHPGSQPEASWGWSIGATRGSARTATFRPRTLLRPSPASRSVGWRRGHGRAQISPRSSARLLALLGRTEDADRLPDGDTPRRTGDD